MRRVLRALLPGGGILVAAAAFLHLADAEVVEAIAARYALLLYGAGAALGAYFHRSRVFVALLCVAATAVWPGPAGVGGPHLVQGAGLVALLALFTLVADRGVLSPGGLLQLGLGGAAVGLPLLALRFPDRLEPLAAAALPESLAGAWPEAQLLAAAAAPAALVTFVGLYRRSGPVNRALGWSQGFVLVAAYPGTGPPGSALFLMAAGLTLAVSVVETSHAMAYRDELTGLPARRALTRDLSGLRGTYSVAMVDVDHFKAFNDHHGHEVGDQVLKLVASRLAGAPGVGKAYRYGGEEFTLVYKGRGAEDVHPHLEAVRKAVEDAEFTLRAWARPKRKPPPEKRRKGKWGSRKLSVTVSVGVADSGGGAVPPEEVLDRADRALYRAKESGRNRVAK